MYSIQDFNANLVKNGSAHAAVTRRIILRQGACWTRKVGCWSWLTACPLRQTNAGNIEGLYLSGRFLDFWTSSK